MAWNTKKKIDFDNLSFKECEEIKSNLNKEISDYSKKASIAWTLIALCMVVSGTLNVVGSKSIDIILLNYISALLLFANAYINYKKAKNINTNSIMLKN